VVRRESPWRRRSRPGHGGFAVAGRRRPRCPTGQRQAAIGGRRPASSRPRAASRSPVDLGDRAKRVSSKIAITERTSSSGGPGCFAAARCAREDRSPPAGRRLASLCAPRPADHRALRAAPPTREIAATTARRRDSVGWGGSDWVDHEVVEQLNAASAPHIRRGSRTACSSDSASGSVPRSRSRKARARCLSSPGLSAGSSM